MVEPGRSQGSRVRGLGDITMIEVALDEKPPCDCHLEHFGGQLEKAQAIPKTTDQNPKANVRHMMMPPQ